MKNQIKSSSTDVTITLLTGQNFPPNVEKAYSDGFSGAEQVTELSESPFANSKDVLPIFEADSVKYDHLHLWALTRGGTWIPIFSMKLEDYSSGYIYPLMLRFGYTQDDKSGSNGGAL